MADRGSLSPAAARPFSRGLAAPPGPIGLRLALAFLAVALAAVALLAGLTAAFTAADVSHLTGQQRAEMTKSLAAAAGVVQGRTGSWAAADLSPLLDLAEPAEAAQIRDRSGRPVATTPGFAARGASSQFSAPITVRGRRVGVAVAEFTGSGLVRADHAMQAALLRAVAGAAGLAALLAALTGLAIARRITRPVTRLIAVTRAMGLGDHAARVGPIPAPGELGELATAFDQMADRLDRQEQMRRDMVADVAHELRTPIAVLQAGHEALLDGIAAPTPDQLASLRDEVLRVARIVEDLQTLAAADAAAVYLTISRCDLADIAAAAADSLASRFDAAGITLDLTLAPADILADSSRMHQVITNLLTNALKFTPSGGRVTVETGPVGPDALLHVADNGVGIPADELPRIFDRFWRGRQASHVSGSGIGLAVATELARAHGGRLSAASEPGNGTQLTLTLPRQEAGTKAVGRVGHSVTGSSSPLFTGAPITAMAAVIAEAEGNPRIP